jgi:branched-chain amino acid transport system permease protein
VSALYVTQFLVGLANAMSLFLIASGLSLVFGVSRIVNFAHGSFYMLGAYLAYAIIAGAGGASWSFGVALLAAPLGVAALGWAVERLLLRRVYRAPELYPFLLTFGLVLILQDAVRHVWGAATRVLPMPALFRGSVSVLGQAFPVYYLVVIAMGPVVWLGLWLLFARTRWGVLVRAATADREMTAALGVDEGRLMTSVFVFGAWLAGLGGMLASPVVALEPGMDLAVIVQVFVVVVVGGMGSFLGSLLAAVLIAELNAFGVLWLPGMSLVLIFVLMAVVLVVRPWGLLGGAPAAHRPDPGAAAEAPRWSRGWLVGSAVGAAALAVLPVVVPAFVTLVATEVLALALFAASLNLLLGYGGIVSFGHAAYFGLGAYAAALLVSRAGWPMPVAFALAPLVAALGALVYGFFCVRLTAIYLAMLTLAFAQITFTVALQWYDFTGGDNGIVGVWPVAALSTPARYYAFALAVTLASFVLLWRIVRSPFGLAVQAIRDDPRRALSVGLDVRLYRLVTFVLAGFLAGLAGALYAFEKGSVFPEFLGIARSIDPLVMVLLGGSSAFGGPVLGAAAFRVLETAVAFMRDYWGAVLGSVLTLLVLVFPRGIAGAWR